MKTLITIFTTIALLASSHPLQAKGFSEYFICEFNDSISIKDIQSLIEDGFQIVETHNVEKVIYVRTVNDSQFSSNLKARMKEIIKVDKNGHKTYVIEPKTESPEFVKLIFNFI